MDGGDCCKATCESERYQCGISGAGQSDGPNKIPIGFPFCADLKYNCQNGQDDYWIAKSSNIPLLVGQSSSARITMSFNGLTMIVAEPELKTIRAFDQVDSSWEQQGQLFEGEAGSRFCTMVSTTTLLGVVVGRRSG